MLKRFGNPKSSDDAIRAVRSHAHAKVVKPTPSVQAMELEGSEQAQTNANVGTANEMPSDAALLLAPMVLLEMLMLGMSVSKERSVPRSAFVHACRLVYAQQAIRVLAAAAMSPEAGVREVVDEWTARLAHADPHKGARLAEAVDLVREMEPVMHGDEVERVKQRAGETAPADAEPAGLFVRGIPEGTSPVNIAAFFTRFGPVLGSALLPNGEGYVR